MNRPTADLRQKDLGALRAIFGRFPWIHEVRLFGSRATGNARRASDIDLAISSPTATAAQWQEVVTALEEAPIIYEIDLVRMERAASPSLTEKIKQEGIEIYSKNQTFGT
jgi:hypothetical protein